MRMPVNYIGIVRGFSSSHRGIDFGWSSKLYGSNQPIYAVDDGVVIYKYKQTSGGNVLHIRHDNGFISEYGHMSEFKVEKGEQVKKGQVIGLMGRTGKVTGNHLHFGLYKGTSINYKVDKFVNPLPYLCVYDEQTVSNGTQNEYKLNYTKEVYNVPSEPLNVRNSLGKLVDELYNGDETEYYGKNLLGKAVVDKAKGWTTIAKYLR